MAVRYVRSAAIFVVSVMLSACGGAKESAPATPVPAALNADIDFAGLARVVEDVVNDPATARTQAILIVYKGDVVAEQYAEGFDAETRFLSASVGKMLLAGAVGVAVGDGLLDLDKPAPVAAWNDADDPRRSITLRQLLSMRSGLEWNEDDTNPDGDAVQMLAGVGRRDSAAYAAQKPLAIEPGAQQMYSSGTTNLISGIVRDAVGGSIETYHSFLKEKFFEPIGMTRTTPNYDEAGTWLASTNVWSTARDFAAYGELLRNDGVSQDGERILPEGWVAQMTTPFGETFEDELWQGYGLQTQTSMVDPKDSVFGGSFGHHGFGGQFIYVDPARELTLVRYSRILMEDDEVYGNYIRQFKKLLAFFPQHVESGVPVLVE